MEMEVRIPPKLDNEAVFNRIRRGLKRYMESNGLENAVMGLSGGVDSSTTLMILSKTIPKENIYVYILPSGTTSKESIELAYKMVEVAGVENVRKISIEPILERYIGALGLGKKEHRVVIGNTAARIRMTILYAEANRIGKAAVVGTGDRSEWLIGYFTKYGDGAADVFPIGSIYKTQLRDFAAWLGVPVEIAYRPSTPELWEGQTAEGELGISYEEIDSILYLYIDKRLRPDEIVKLTGIERDKVDLVLNRVRESEHKRSLPPIL